MYVSIKDVVVGLLKVGTKNLYLFDSLGQTKKVDNSPCILDFYVHESRQRTGLGKKLFDIMLAEENWIPVKCSVDRPSEKLLQFLKKHYGLEIIIPQANKFVLYQGFFDDDTTANSEATNEEQQQCASTQHPCANAIANDNTYKNEKEQTNEKQQHCVNESTNDETYKNSKEQTNKVTSEAEILKRQKNDNECMYEVTDNLACGTAQQQMQAILFDGCKQSECNEANEKHNRRNNNFTNDSQSQQAAYEMMKDSSNTSSANKEMNFIQKELELLRFERELLRRENELLKIKETAPSAKTAAKEDVIPFNCLKQFFPDYDGETNVNVCLKS
ncbi:alpha-tubulin N-acetyltransferase 2-like [Rhagoletis pomonella]|uniref:alpha-tubulin N-acetyltransferase 2-like n=1 Tax=Rhagoletis pomonella TaxID=28610 RepID=UPI00177C1FF2|nr:alpha-tubulin N-acetyltransferase 2-like [Rhagoletis pomonella]